MSIAGTSCYTGLLILLAYDVLSTYLNIILKCLLCRWNLRMVEGDTLLLWIVTVVVEVAVVVFLDEQTIGVCTL